MNFTVGVLLSGVRFRGGGLRVSRARRGWWGGSAKTIDQRGELTTFYMGDDEGAVFLERASFFCSIVVGL